ncbi:MAG: hypothetical protein WCB04_08360 [Mycobacteriales bacterium]
MSHAPRVSRSSRAGIVILGILSVGDLATPLLTDGDHPPMVVAWASAVLGAASLVLAVAVWRGRPGTTLPLATVRIVSALTAVPAFFTADVPAVAVVAAVAVIALTALGLGLLFSGSSTRRAAVTTR